MKKACFINMRHVLILCTCMWPHMTTCTSVCGIETTNAICVYILRGYMKEEGVRASYL